MDKIIINIPIRFKTMTAKEFIDEFRPCSDSVQWMRKLGLNKPVMYFWNRCARRGWLQHILWRLSPYEWQKIEHLLNDNHDAFGKYIDHHEAQRFRDAIEINWI